MQRGGLASGALPSEARPAGATWLGRVTLRILVAEDNIINQWLARRILTRVGYQADCAGNGTEALEAMRLKDYDVVLMDMQMPGMDGIETTLAIRSTLPTARQPWIIAVTANAASSSRAACLASGMNDYVSKPFVLEQLAELLARVPAV